MYIYTTGTQLIFHLNSGVSNHAKICYSKSMFFFRWLPTLLQFTIVCRQYKLDGFVIEIPEEYHHNDIHVSQVFEIYMYFKKNII